MKIKMSLFSLVLILFSAFIAPHSYCYLSEQYEVKGKFFQSFEAGINGPIILSSQIINAQFFSSNKKGFNSVVELTLKSKKSGQNFYQQNYSVWFEDQMMALNFIKLLKKDDEKIFFFNISHNTEFKNKLEIAGRILFSFNPQNQKIEPLIQ